VLLAQLVPQAQRVLLVIKASKVQLDRLVQPVTLVQRARKEKLDLQVLKEFKDH
jgi:hypothetical protein